MRVVSQNGMARVDLPYGNIGLSIRDRGDTAEIFAFSIGYKQIWKLAEYETMTEAINALSLLNDMYVEMDRNTDFEGRTQIYQAGKVFCFPEGTN